jgi:hypothetical protein
MLERWFTGLDAASRSTLRRFAVTIAVVGVLSLFARPGAHTMFFSAMTGVAVAVSAALAMVARDRFNAPSLNRWDETLAYIEVTILAM